MKLVADAHRCVGHGRCYTIAPALLQPDADGFVTIRGSAIEIPAGSAAAAREAAGWCPEGALDIIED